MHLHSRLPIAMLIGIMLAAACAPISTPRAAGLTIEEHQLLGAPTLEPRSFTPVDATMEDVLRVHADARARVIPDASELIDGRHAIRRSLGSDELIATEDGGAIGSSNSVADTRNGREIYRIEAGMPSPIPGLRGLWTYDDHWALETVYIAPETLAGLLAIDGQQVVPGHGFDEGFEFQILAGEPFYFARQGSHIGYFYAGDFTAAGYDEVPHYGCCSGAALNPIHAQNMVAFFARRGGTWYYVEIGVFSE